MKKALKSISKFLKYFLAIFLLIIVLTGLALYFLIDKDHYKTLFVQQLEKNLHRELTIQGPIEVSLWPRLEMTLNHPIIYNKPDFPQKVFIQADKLIFGMEWLPLLQRKLELASLYADRLEIHLAKNKAGKSNWEDLSGEGSSGSFSLPALILNKASLSYQDAMKNESVELKDLNLHRRASLVITPTNLDLSFTYLYQGHSGKVKLSANTYLALDQKLHLDHLQTSAQIKEKGLNLDIDFEGEGAYDLKHQQFSLEKIKGKAYTLNFIGQVFLKDLKGQPYPEGKFNLQLDDLKSFLQASGLPIPKDLVLKNLSGELDLHKNVYQGDFKVITLKAGSLELENLSTHANFLNQVLKLSSINANCYEGRLIGDLSFDFSQASPAFKLHSEMRALEAKKLLEKLGSDSQISFSGKGDINLDLASQGNTEAELLSHLQGQGNMNFKNGLITGIDILYWVFNGYAILNNSTPPSMDSKQSQYGDLKASFNINSGVVTNQDLLLQTPFYLAKGSGSVNLVNSKIDYQILALRVKSESDSSSAKDLLSQLLDGNTSDPKTDQDAKIPILIKGRLNRPEIGLDTTALVSDVAAKQIGKAVTKYLIK